jgi:hypothetical protein
MEQEVQKLESLLRVLWSEYAEIVGLFYMAQFAQLPQVQARYRTIDLWRGYEAVRAALHRALLLGLAKIIFDDDKWAENPSIRRLHKDFSKEREKLDSPLLAYLRHRFVETLKGMKYDRLLDEIFEHWKNLSESASWKGLKTLRDKIIAHTDITFSDGEWRLINPNELKLTVADFDKIRTGVQDFLNGFNFAVFGRQLNFDEVHRKGKTAAAAFWKVKITKP